MVAEDQDCRVSRWSALAGFQAALESSPDGIVVLDLAGSPQFFNASALQMFSDSSAVVGVGWETLWTDEARGVAQDALEAAVGGQRASFEANLRTSRGAGRHLHVMVSPLRDDAGDPIAALASCRDLTELVEARERRTGQEANALRAVVESSHINTWEIDFRRGLVLVTEEGMRLLHGDTQARALPLEECVALVLDDDQRQFRETLDRIRQGERVFFEGRFRRYDDTIGWVRTFAEPIFDHDECVGARAAGIDITEEKLAREEIERAGQRFRLAAQLSGIQVYELNFDEHLVLQQGCSTPIFDPPLQFEDLWPSPLNLVHVADRDRVEAEWKEAQRTGAPLRSEFRVRRRDGRDVWVYAVIEAAEADPRRLVAAVSEITERKQTELQLLQTMAEMREHEQRQRLLLDELNHRVKNTLTAVQAMAVQTLAESPASTRDQFIDRLLALSATHNLLVKRVWAEASFRELIETVLTPFGHTYEYQGPDLSLDPHYTVSLGIALHELAINAIKHGAWRRKGRVTIQTTSSKAEVCIVWRESGGGPVAPPVRQGFGTRLLKRGVAGELGGEVTLDFATDGLACTIRAPVSKRLRVVEAGDAHAAVIPRPPQPNVDGQFGVRAR